uniref:Capsid protein n=1 Tax=Geolu virus TaxID=2800917 RepID=A0A894KKI9_9VIRU|nr:MAG: capsid protein [Geolu virus]
MNTVVVRNQRNGRRSNTRAIRRRRVQPVVMVAPTGAPRRNRRRRNRRPARDSRPRNGGRTGSSETFTFNKESLKDNSSGVLTFGPSLSECVALSGGVLKAFHEYKISMVTVRFVSESSSTAEGSIAYELDAHCKLTSLQSTLRKFPVAKGGTRTFGASQINGVEWHDSSEDQFRLLYKGNGTKGATAGYFSISIRVQLHNPK